MDYTLSPLPLQINTTPNPGRRKRRHRPAKNGRLYVFLIFLWMRAVDVGILTFIYPLVPSIHKQVMLSQVLVTAIWTTVLLGAIWFRQKWAKYILAASLLCGVIYALTEIPALPDVRHPKREFAIIMGFTAAYLPVALILIASRQINRLTTQSFKIEGSKAPDRRREIR